MENKLQIFENGQFGQIRVVEHNGAPWFVVADVCKALDVGNPSQAIARLEDDEKMNTLISNEGNQRGNPNMTVVNESGLYALIFGSRKPEAKVFKRWVTHEVLPTIRRTGGYVQQDREEEFIERYFPAFSDETKLIMVKDLRTQVLALKADNAKQQINTCSAVWTLPLHWGTQSPETRSPPITGTPKVTNKGQIYFVNKFLKEAKGAISCR